MEILRIQPIGNNTNFSYKKVERPVFAPKLSNSLTQDCFVRSLNPSSVSNPKTVAPTFAGSIIPMNYEFETKFTRKFFQKLLKEGVPDAYSDIENLIPLEELDKHRNLGTFSKKSQLAIKYLKKYRESMFPIEKEILSILETLSKKHPTMNLQELLRLRYAGAEQVLINQQSEVLNKINLMIRQLPKKDFLTMRKFLQESFDKIFAQNPTPEERFGRKNFLEALKKVDIEDVHFKKKIYAIAEQLPQSTNSINAFIVKYSQPYRFRYDKNRGELVKLPRDSQEIGERLMEPSIATDDHIHPHKEFKKEHREREQGKKEAQGLSTLRVTTLASRKTNEAKTDTPLDDFIVQSECNIPSRLQHQIDRYIHICEKWHKCGRFEDADLLADYIVVLKNEYELRSDIVKIDISDFEKKIAKIKADKEEHFSKLKTGKNNHNHHESHNHIKRTDGASNSHKERYIDSNGNVVENRKFQKHSSRFSG